jgi:hypothetical protein
MILSIRDKDSMMNSSLNERKSLGDEQHKQILQDALMLPQDLKSKE